MLECMLAFMIGIVIGVSASNIVRIIWMSDGVLGIDQTDPDKDMYKLEIEDLDILPKKRTVILKVVVKIKDALK